MLLCIVIFILILENLKKAIDKFEFTALLFDQQVKSVDYSK